MTKFLKGIVIVLLTFCISTAAFADVTFVNSTSGATHGNVSSVTFAYTVTSGSSNYALIVLASTTANTPANAVITGITYNSVALTKVTDQTNGAERAEAWYLLNPLVGSSANIVITYTGFTTRGVYGAASFANVDQTTPIDDFDGVNSAGATHPTVTLNPTVAGTMAVDNVSAAGTSGRTLTADGTQSEMWDLMLNNTAMGSGSYLAVPGSSNQATGYVISSSAAYGYVAFLLKPVTGGGGSSIKTGNGLAVASVKTWQNLAIASTKSKNGLQ